MFNSELIDPSVHKELPLGYSLRPLALQDISKGYLNVLQQLTTVGSVDQTNFENRFRKLESSGNAYFPIVIEKNQGNIVAAGTLLIEYKFIHECGCVGHIEDIVVDENERGKKLGLRYDKSLDSQFSKNCR